MHRMLRTCLMNAIKEGVMNNSSNLRRQDRIRGLSSDHLIPSYRPIGSCSSFEIYRAEQVMLTSTQLGGGDWHWRLSDRFGKVLADCGGYRNSSECLSIVQSLRSEATNASILPISGLWECE